MNQVSANEREERIRALREHDTVKDAARALDMNYRTLHKWSRRNYPMHEEQFGNNDYNALSQEERERRLEALRESRTITEAARRLGLKRDTLGAWSRNNYEDHDADFVDYGNRRTSNVEERGLMELRLELLGVMRDVDAALHVLEGVRGELEGLLGAMSPLGGDEV